MESAKPTVRPYLEDDIELTALPEYTAEDNAGFDRPSSDDEAKRSDADFKPSKRLYVAFLTLATITLMVALDGTSLSVALPVCRSQSSNQRI